MQHYHLVLLPMPCSISISVRPFAMISLKSVLCGAAALTLSAAALAAPPPAVSISDAWSRATVQGQPTGSAFMTIKANRDVEIVGVTSAIANTTQLHEMSMNGSTMTMRQMESLPIKAGQSVTLSPDGMHVMLFGLKSTLRPGDHFPVILSVKLPDQSLQSETVQVEVRPLAQ
jgi:copper(I)-binding protein